MKKAEEVRHMQNNRMQHSQRYKDLEIEIGSLIAITATDQNDRRVTVNVKNIDVPLVLLLATTYGYHWSYLPSLDQNATISIDITW